MLLPLPGEEGGTTQLLAHAPGEKRVMAWPPLLEVDEAIMPGLSVPTPVPRREGSNIARLPLALLGGGRWRKRLSRARERLSTHEPTKKGRQFLLPAPGRRGPNSYPSHRCLGQ